MDEARAKALVVDDEESIRSVLHQALTDAGLDVLTADSGLQALDVLSRSEIEVMLLDILRADKHAGYHLFLANG